MLIKMMSIKLCPILHFVRLDIVPPKKEKCHHIMHLFVTKIFMRLPWYTTGFVVINNTADVLVNTFEMGLPDGR